ncbi:MAG: hypothetical protein IPG23_13455 [Burkholderiales bacterium]|jgi:hypothetical protein|nr:hypothetical protein [Burkholderiales bacterium]
MTDIGPVEKPKRGRPLSDADQGFPIETTFFRALDGLALECDGLTRVISTLLQRDGITHQVCVGSLTIPNKGAIPLHWWIVLSDGRICDFRAHMWLDDDQRVPHGVFSPEAHHQYEATHDVDPNSVALPSAIFSILTGKQVGDFPRLVDPSTLAA